MGAVSNEEVQASHRSKVGLGTTSVNVPARRSQPVGFPENIRPVRDLPRNDRLKDWERSRPE